MNKKESAIISAYTGFSFGARLFNEFHSYIEEKFGHPIFTHQMTGDDFWKKVKELSKDDFINLSNSIVE